MDDRNDYVVFEHVRKVYHVGEVDIEAAKFTMFPDIKRPVNRRRLEWKYPGCCDINAL